MKSVLISIQPKWVEKIASGEKTIEVRKTKPKLETPFKCYIYCTKGKPTIFESDGLVNGDIPYFYNGYVMGEFVCDKIEEYAPALFNGQDFYQNFGVSEEIKTCLSLKEVCEYGKGKLLYGWHISNLKIYDKPKELSEFRKPCKFAYSSYEEGICYEDCEQGKLEDCRNFCLPLTRPPQSWCYVESLGE